MSAVALPRRVAGRVSVVLVAATVLVALIVGSTHHVAPSRVAYLESIIKCPSCEDLSIAQSTATTAGRLREEVTAGVRAGWSNARIEREVVAQYSSNEILVPTGGLSALAWEIPLAAMLIAVLGLGFVFVRRRSVNRDRSQPVDVDSDDLARVEEALSAVRRGSP